MVIRWTTTLPIRATHVSPSDSSSPSTIYSCAGDTIVKNARFIVKRGISNDQRLDDRAVVARSRARGREGGSQIKQSRAPYGAKIFFQAERM